MARYTKETLKEARYEYETVGTGVHSLSRKYSIPNSSLFKIIKREGWEKLSRAEEFQREAEVRSTPAKHLTIIHSKQRGEIDPNQVQKAIEDDHKTFEQEVHEFSSSELSEVLRGQRESAKILRNAFNQETNKRAANPVQVDSLQKLAHTFKDIVHAELFCYGYGEVHPFQKQETAEGNSLENVTTDGLLLAVNEYLREKTEKTAASGAS